jgi:hypothetical protein
VHRVEQWLVVLFEFLYHRSEHVRPDGVEPEVHVEHVEPIMIRGDPARFEHQWRPPSPGHGAAVLGDRIMQSHYIIRTIWVR